MKPAPTPLKTDATELDMTNKPLFPGMNPYLERPDIWSQIHYGLISGLMRTLNPVLNPKYRAAVDKRVYLDSVLAERRKPHAIFVLKLA